MLQLDGLAAPGVRLRDCRPAEPHRRRASALDATVFADTGERYLVGLDASGSSRAVEGPVSLPPFGRRMLRVRARPTTARVGGYRVAYHATGPSTARRLPTNGRCAPASCLGRLPHRGVRRARHPACMRLSPACDRAYQPDTRLFHGYIPASGSPSPPAVPNASGFLDLYAFERPGPALPVDEFVEELKALIRAHPIEDTLAEALRYGTASREAMQRWIKDYYQFIRLDAQGTAAMIARCRRRGLFLALSQLVNRKTGFHQVTRRRWSSSCASPPRSMSAPDELEAHYACPETMQATYTRLQFQFSSFEEGFVVSALASEGSLLDVVRDERPWLCQRGIAEYMKRA